MIDDNLPVNASLAVSDDASHSGVHFVSFCAFLFPIIYSRQMSPFYLVTIPPLAVASQILLRH